MDIELYQELSGNTVEEEDLAKTTAQIRRTRTILESMLGYSLNKKKASENQYEEAGKAKVDCPFRGLISDIDNLELNPKDPVLGSYRLFSYNRSDEFLAVDPFTKLNAVKLVFLKAGAEPNGITHKTFESGKIRVHKKNGIAKFIQRCNECYCSCECDDCVQLAVDAEWLNEECAPEELLIIWADMIEYYSDPKRNVVAETLGTHSYKLSEKGSPETFDESIAIIKKYAGPNGSVNKTVVV